MEGRALSDLVVQVESSALGLSQSLNYVETQTRTFLFAFC